MNENNFWRNVMSLSQPKQPLFKTEYFSKSLKLFSNEHMNFQNLKYTAYSERFIFYHPIAHAKKVFRKWKSVFETQKIKNLFFQQYKGFCLGKQKAWEWYFGFVIKIKKELLLPHINFRTYVEIYSNFYRWD